MKIILHSFRIIVVLTLLTGALYPLAVTALSQFLFANKANGSLIFSGEKLIGSSLLAQKTADARYFWPRPSAADYATVASGASNKGPTSSDLVKAIASRREQFGADAPVDLLTASGSGLDPHISPTAAHFQTTRIAGARGLPVEKVEALVAAHIDAPQWGILGERRVNVLTLNLALDALH